MAYRITKVYTRNGDSGETRLGGGQILRKDALRIRAYGCVDELNSTLGLALAAGPKPPVADALQAVQHQLFTLGGDLCILETDKANLKVKGVQAESVTFLENLIDRLLKDLAPLADFILPGGTQAAAFLHQARCVCRRAETLLVELSQEEALGEFVLPYINRLSDALFVLARYENHLAGCADILWRKEA